MVYLIPEDTTMKIVVSDFEKHLDITKEKASMEIAGIDESFEKLMEKKMSPDEDIRIAEVSSSQINSLIIELTDSGATQEWVERKKEYIFLFVKHVEQNPRLRASMPNVFCSFD